VHAFFTSQVTFNPGPSQLTPRILQEMHAIADNGFLSLSHRGADFMQVSKQAIEGLRDRMHLPAAYRIFYQPSATAAMDTLLRNLVLKKSFHFVHGAFAEVFFNTARDMGLEALIYHSPWEQPILWEQASLPAEVELIAITHNETSTGLMWPQRQLTEVRKRYPEILLAIDVTLSFGTMEMSWEEADIWFGSVQKCLGLPSGLGFLIVSPRAFDRALEVYKKRGGVPAWQRFEVLAEKMQRYQTPETPNMLAIALLAHQMQAWDLTAHERQMHEKAQVIYGAALPWKPYVSAAEWRSLTVVNMCVDVPKEWHRRAEQAQMHLGQGYGRLKDSCVRLANFPAISLQHVEALLNRLSIP